MNSPILRIYKSVLLLIVVTAIVHSLAAVSWGRYVGPAEILSTTVGNSPDQMHSESDDMGADHYAGISFVKTDGTIVIVDGPYDFSDFFNIKIFKSGNLIRYFSGPKAPWLPEVNEVNEHGIYIVGAHQGLGIGPYKYDIYIYDFEGKIKNIKFGSYIGKFFALLPNGDFATKDNGNYYYRYSPSGQLLNKHNKAPLELGDVKKEVLFDDKSRKTYKTIITYDDNTYEIIDKVEEDAKLQRDGQKNIYAIGTHYDQYVKRYNSCGQLQGIVTLPENIEFREEGDVTGRDPEIFHHTQYASPVIDAQGNVYAVKVTPGKYSIIKWTWENESDVANLCTEKKLLLNILSYFQYKAYEGDKRLYNDDDIRLWCRQVTGNNIESVRKLFVKALRNEIYARHGRFFDSPDLRQIFDSVTWYKHRRKFIESELNAVEKQNVEKIVQYEKKMGWK